MCFRVSISKRCRLVIKKRLPQIKKVGRNICEAAMLREQNLRGIHGTRIIMVTKMKPSYTLPPSKFTSSSPCLLDSLTLSPSPQSCDQNILPRCLFYLLSSIYLFAFIFSMNILGQRSVQGGTAPLLKTQNPIHILTIPHTPHNVTPNPISQHLKIPD